MGRLKWLWIHDNEFTGMVPEQIGVLKKLEGVTLHGNKFAPIVREKSTVQENEDKALKEDANKEVNSQPEHDEQTDAKYTNGGEEKQEDAVENNDWISTLKGNIIPESLCSLMSTKTLKHLWTDCEEKALVHASGEKSDLVIKEGAHACSCCTRCFPKMVSIPAE
jgi:muramoyltetrapeptide carboxypeptidase LdcA involved in peptidoglycan recycling